MSPDHHPHHSRKKIHDYIQGFYAKNPVYQRQVREREEHLYRVADLSMDISMSMEAEKDKLMLAEVAGLLHDIGRFEQFRQYKTFVDAFSEDHAHLSVAVIRNEKFLDFLSKEQQQVVCDTILHHNKAMLPGELDGDALFYARVLRDADTIDLFRMLSLKYHRGITTDETAFPDIPQVSPEIFEAVMNEGAVDISSVSSLNDLKLLQLAWIYQLNFRESFVITHKEGHYHQLMNILHESRETAQLKNKLNFFLADKITNT